MPEQAKRPKPWKKMMMMRRRRRRRIYREFIRIYYSKSNVEEVKALISQIIRLMLDNDDNNLEHVQINNF
jgi:thiaminase